METLEEKEKKYLKQQSREKKWNELIAEKRYIEVIKEFDLLYLKKSQDLTIYDLVIREKALKAIGISSFTEEKAKKEIGVRYESRRGKS